MKKPTPKNTPPAKDGGGEIPGQVLGKILDVGKGALSTGDSIVGLFKEKERTKQVLAEAAGRVAEAKEITRQTVVNAGVQITDIHRAHHENVMKHEQAMAKLQGEREDARVRNRASERLLDKLLDEQGNKEILAEEYRATITSDRKP